MQQATAGVTPSASWANGRNAGWLPRWSIVLFMLIAVVLTIADLHTISGPHVETGDFAANGLLILDAKKLQLLTGNYSRVGFNHPGPAILYVLALGEVLFFDVLHIVDSPVSGQMIAAILYNSFWIVLLSRLFLRTFPRWQEAAIAISVFVIATSVFDHDFFSGMWFPHLYYFPFAVMVTSIARVARGSADSLPSLAVSSGFLLNGHVAFVAVLGIMLIGAFATNLLLTRKERDHSLIGTVFYRSHRHVILRSVAIFAISLIPLMIATVLYFPGPIRDYASFGGSHRPNTPREALTFLSVYWGGREALAVATALLIVIWRVAKWAWGRDVDVRALVAMLVAATLATFAYAKYGIDILEYKYLALFYYAIPALAASVVAAILVPASDRASRWAAGVLVLASAGVAVAAVHKVPDYLWAYHEPQIIGLEKGLEDLKSDGRIVLELDNSKNWGAVWSTVLGVELYAKRHHHDLFCVDRNWHISNTKAARCTAAELAGHRRLLVDMTDPEPTPDREPAVKGATVSFYPWNASSVEANTYFGVQKDANAFHSTFLASGWTPVDGIGVWTESKEARLEIPIDADRKGTIVLDASAFLPRDDSRQDVTIFIGDRQVGTATFNRSHDRQQIEIPFEVASAGYLELRFVVTRPLSPRESHISDDPRRLGIALYGFTLRTGI